MINVLNVNVKRIWTDFPGLIRKLLLSWLISVALEYLLLPASTRDLAGLEGIAAMSFPRVILLFCGFLLLFMGISQKIDTAKLERWCIVGAYAVLMSLALLSSFTLLFFVTCLLVLAVLIVYAIRGWNSQPMLTATNGKGNSVFIWITVFMAFIFFAFICAWTVGRIYSFATPTFDFTIFSQMFHYMKETGAPLTTVERDGLLSHFDVHVSPIFYLMLPFYWLAPSPVTLQVLQALIMASAAYPLWKICKDHGFSGFHSMLVCAVLLAFPAYSGGAGYDLHENCFLTPLILWLFYGIDKKNTAITAVAAVLTLMVKEDAAVYVAVIALWLIVKTLLHPDNLDKKNLITGMAMLVGSLTWFLAVTAFLEQSGDGVMTNRYDNLIYDGSSSLIAVIKSVILNPMKAVFESVDADKLMYILKTMVPLLGLPLLTRRYERYLLMIPYVLINLMSDYKFQHDLFFQYNFGSTAFLIYLTVINLSDIKIDKLRSIALVATAVICCVTCGRYIVPNGMPNAVMAVSQYDSYQSIRDTLSKIPDDASVTATSFYTTHLSQREVIYDVEYCSEEHLLETEYVALQIDLDWAYADYATPGENDGFTNLVKLLEKNGYEIYTGLEDVLVIYHKQTA